MPNETPVTNERKQASIILPMAVNHPFSYSYDDFPHLKIGQLVEVPFRKGKKTGVVLNFDPANISSDKLKSVANSNDIALSENLIKFLDWASKYYLAPWGMLLKSVISPLKNWDKIKDYQADNPELKIQEITLNDCQNEVLTSLAQKLEAGYSVSVLEGVTGSGKTEVYISLIVEQIKKGGQILVMLPEIMLTNQIFERFKKRLGDVAIEWHSGLTPNKRQENWLKVYHGNAKLVIGARSALFLPFKDLQLIVIDEEHDVSYKQDESVVYNARDLAVVRAKIEGIPLVLCSATPSLETCYNVEQGKYESFYLSGRFGDAKLPNFQITSVPNNKEDILSKELLNEITQTLENNLQSLLFINRRGYAPFSVCSGCGYKYQCPNCQFYLVYHKKGNFLQCHHCAHQYKDESCPKCEQAEKMNNYGLGAEKLAEYLEEKFPQARIALVTSDSISTRNKAQKMLQSIIDGEVDIIVGTQLISKGLHFPKLTTIGIVGIEDAFNTGDFRVLERTYQLLQQVSGRAGREKFAGKVLLQCEENKKSFIESIVENGGKNFIKTELENRKLMNMPPFSRVALIHASAFNEISLMDFMDKLGRAMPTANNVEVLGPVPAPVYFVRKRYRYRFILKAARNVNLQGFISHWLKHIEVTGNIQVKVDIEPYSFL